MQVIFDSEGTIFFQGSGFPEPVGELGYLKVDVPEGQYLKEIDMSTGKPVPKFEPYPKSEMEILKEKVAQLEVNDEAIFSGIESVSGGAK